MALNDTEPECPLYFEPWNRKCYHFSPSVSGGSLVYLTWNQAKVGLNHFSSVGVSGSHLSPRLPVRRSTRRRASSWSSPERRAHSSTVKHWAPSSGSTPTGASAPTPKLRDVSLCILSPHEPSALSQINYIFGLRSSQIWYRERWGVGELEGWRRESDELHSLGSRAA